VKGIYVCQLFARNCVNMSNDSVFRSILQSSTDPSLVENIMKFVAESGNVNSSSSDMEPIQFKVVTTQMLGLLTLDKFGKEVYHRNMTLTFTFVPDRDVQGIYDAARDFLVDDIFGQESRCSVLFQGPAIGNGRWSQPMYFVAALDNKSYIFSEVHVRDSAKEANHKDFSMTFRLGRIKSMVISHPDARMNMTIVNHNDQRITANDQSRIFNPDTVKKFLLEDFDKRQVQVTSQICMRCRLPI